MQHSRLPVWAVINGEVEQFENNIASRFAEVTGSEDARYFNSGVLLINLREWQHQKISEKALDFLRAHSEELSFPDQDALNAVIAGNWGALSPRWNKQVIRIGQPESASVLDRGITHYTSHKPWNRDYTWRCSEIFFHAYMRSSWDSVPKALVWSAARYAEQVMRRNAARIARRLRRRRN